MNIFFIQKMKNVNHYMIKILRLVGNLLPDFCMNLILMVFSDTINIMKMALETENM